MTKDEVAEAIYGFAESLPERVSGNEAHPIVAKRIAKLVATERPAVVELLRDWIGVRIPESKRGPEDSGHEAAMWLALEIFQRYALE